MGANSGEIPNLHVIYELTDMLATSAATTDASKVADSTAKIYDSAGLKGSVISGACHATNSFFTVHDGDKGDRDAADGAISSKKCGPALTGSWQAAGEKGTKEND